MRTTRKQSDAGRYTRVFFVDCAGAVVYLKKRELDGMKRTAAKLRSETDIIAQAIITEREQQAREVEEATQILRSYPSGNGTLQFR